MSELPMIGTVADVAKWLGWTESKLRARLHTGRGHPPYTRPAGSIEFRRDDVLAWYASLPTTPPADEAKPGRPIHQPRHNRMHMVVLEQRAQEEVIRVLPRHPLAQQVVVRDC